MSWLEALHQEIKVAWFIGAGLLAIGALAAADARRLVAAHDAVAEITENWVPSIDLVDKMSTTLRQYRLEEARLILATFEDEMVPIEARTQELTTQMSALRDRYEPLITAKNERGMLARFDQKWAEYLRLSRTLVALARRNEDKRAAELLNVEQQGAYVALSRSIQNLVEFNVRSLRQSADQVGATYHETRLIAIGALGAGAVVLAGAVVVAFIGRRQRAPSDGD
jgi:methyl-accepting chemotaxis protein